jgi:hypothetical protein
MYPTHGQDEILLLLHEGLKRRNKIVCWREGLDPSASIHSRHNNSHACHLSSHCIQQSTVFSSEPTNRTRIELLAKQLEIKSTFRVPLTCALDFPVHPRGCGIVAVLP